MMRKLALLHTKPNFKTGGHFYGLGFSFYCLILFSKMVILKNSRKGIEKGSHNI